MIFNTNLFSALYVLPKLLEVGKVVSSINIYDATEDSIFESISCL